MKRVRTFLLYVLMLMLMVLNTAAAVAQSTAHIEDAQNCWAMERGKNLIAKYEKLDDPFKGLYMGIVYHNLAVNNNKTALAKALELTKKAVETTKHPLASGYYGSALTIQAGEFYEDGDMMNAMEKLQDGIAVMDDAVKQGPGNMGLRILRIENSLGLSNASPINRFDKIKEDLGFLKQRYETLPSRLKSFYHLYSGFTAKNDNNGDEAMISFEKAVKCSPQSGYAKTAKREIQLHRTHK